MRGDEFIDGPSNQRKADGVAYGFRKNSILDGGGCSRPFSGNSFLGGRSLTPSIADRSMATAQRISGQAMRYATFAQVIFGRSQASFVQAQSATACAQTRLAVVQTAMAHREAALAKVQAEKIRVLASRGVVACPRQNLVINLPEAPVIATEGTI